jgi:hypothetical protein
MLGRAFGLTEHPNRKDPKRVSFRFAGQFIGIKYDGRTINTTEAYLPSAIERTVKAALDLQRNTGMASPIEFACEVWCEPDEEGKETPLGYRYVCYDRRPQRDNDPLLALAYETGMIDRPQGRMTDQTVRDNVDPETGEMI